MQELLQSDTRRSAKEKLLTDLMNWFKQNGKIFGEEALYAEFFVNRHGTLKPGINLKSDLLADSNRGLKVWLGVLVVDPAQVMCNHPEIIEALGVIMQTSKHSNGQTPSPINSTAASAMQVDKTASTARPISAPATHTRKPIPPAKPAVKPPVVVSPPVQHIVAEYPSLAAAIEGEWGKTAAEIDRKWPRSHKKPALHVLATLGQDPERALQEDRNLLNAVYEIFQPILPIDAYPQKLQAKLGKLKHEPRG